MQINEKKCIGCGHCIPYCPVDAITLTERVTPLMVNGKERKKVCVIDFDECVECGVCLRSARCPSEAIYQQDLVYPRTVRSLMSDVLTIAEESQISGRGTEEMKTNEVTGRFKPGIAGVAIEVGRPITGTRMVDVEKIAMAVSCLHVEHEPCNPVTSMMADVNTGKFKQDLLNEKVLSAILEFGIKTEKIPELFDVLKKVEKEIDSVFSLGIACLLNPDGSNPTAPYIEQTGVWVAPNGKINVGLGRPLIKQEQI